MVVRDAFDGDPFVAGTIAADDAHGAARDMERRGEEFDQRGIGGAFDRRRGEAKHEHVPPEPGAFRLAGARDDTDVERDHPTILRVAVASASSGSASLGRWNRILSSRSRASCSRMKSSVLRSVEMLDSIETSTSLRL